MLTDWVVLARQGKGLNATKNTVALRPLPCRASTHTGQQHGAKRYGAGVGNLIFRPTGAEGATTGDGRSEFVLLHSDVERPSVKGLGG
jgi:hypothetical protein